MQNHPQNVPPSGSHVIPAKAGIHLSLQPPPAGMTIRLALDFTPRFSYHPLAATASTQRVSHRPICHCDQRSRNKPALSVAEWVAISLLPQLTNSPCWYNPGLPGLCALALFLEELLCVILI